MAYLAGTMEDDSPRKVSVDNLESPNISWIKSNLTTTFHYARVFNAYNYKQTFVERHDFTRKRRTELSMSVCYGSFHAEVQDLLDIIPSLPDSHLEEIEAPESIF